MKPELQRRIQRYGWDKASEYYERSWEAQLKPAHALLLEVSQVQPGETILDIAAGTGLITFPLAALAGEAGKIIATDISDEMVKIGTTLCDAKGISNVEFQQMDAEQLRLEDNQFDLVTCALGLMYFPDPDRAISEMHRTLKPGGRAVVAVWGSRKKCGWAEIFPIVDARVNTDVCPMFFNLGESEVLTYPFKSVGFTDIILTKLDTQLTYTSAEEACEAAFLGGPVAMAYARFDEPTRKEAKAAYIASISSFKTGNGYKIPGEFVVCSGIKS